MKLLHHLIFACVLSLLSTPISAQRWLASTGSANLLPNNYGVYGIKVVNKDVIWATASLGTGATPANHLIKILRSNNGGQTWQLMNVNGALGQLGFDIQAFDSTTAWISTFVYINNAASSVGRGLFKTIDGGQTWTQKLADPASGSFIRFFDRNNGVCLGYTRRFAYTSDGGDNWTIDSLAFRETEIPSIGFLSTNSFVRQGDTVWLGTTKGRIFRSTNKGRNWTASATDIPTIWSIPSIAFTDSRNGMLVGVDPTNSKFLGLAKTNDGGVTWQTVPMTLVSASFSTAPNLTAIPTKNEKAFLLGTENLLSTTAQSFLTFDQGSNWRAVEKDINSHGASEFLSPQIGWIGNGFVANSRDPTTMFKWADDGVFTPTTELYDNTIFSVSPNPVQEKLTLQFAESSNYEAFDAQITDIAGKVVFKAKTSDKQLTVNYLPAGIYFLTVKTKDKIGVMKFVKN